MTTKHPEMVHDALGMKHIDKATAAQTGGTLSVFEAEMPSGCGVPSHRHERDSELFYQLEGEPRS
jgi:quercetin dioxygenase-like cupin family protein